MSGEEDEGWEGLAEEAPEATLAPSGELEAALQEASDAVEAREAAGKSETTGPASADKLILEALSSELQALKEQYEVRGAEIEQQGDRYLRLQAEFENFRRRTLKERQETLTFGHQNLVKDLLPTVDNLDRAIGHAEVRPGGDLHSLLQGVDLVRRELLGVLAKHGVVGIDAEGEPFDPALHEAMAQTPDASVPPNTIVKVLEKGYQLRDRMLRPARVVVSCASEAEESSEEDAETGSPEGEAQS